MNERNIHISAPFAVSQGRDCIGIAFKYHIFDKHISDGIGILIKDTNEPANHNNLCKVDAELKKRIIAVPWPSHVEIMDDYNAKHCPGA